MELAEIEKVFKTLRKGDLVFLKTENEEVFARLCFVDHINFNIIALACARLRDLQGNVQDIVTPEMLKFIKLVSDKDDDSKGLTICNEEPSVVSDVADVATASNCANQSMVPKDNLVDETEDIDSKSITTSSAVGDATTLLSDQTIHPAVYLSLNEVNILQHRIDNLIFIDQYDPQFLKAMEDMKSQQFISISLEPAKNGRYFKTSIVGVATTQAVYIFDLISLGTFYSDFKSILEAEIPRKAINGSHVVTDFKYQHNIEINGIFDTYAAYCIVTKQKLDVGYVDIIDQFLNVHKDFFNTIDDDYSHYIFRRPLHGKFVRECATRAVFTLKLQEHLQNKMLAPFYDQCQVFSRSWMQANDSGSVIKERQPKPAME